MRGPPLARRIAANIAKLPELLIKTQKFTPSIGSGRFSIAARQTYRLDKSKLRQSQPRANHERARKQRRRSSGDARNCRTSLQRRYRPHVRFGSKADIGAPPSNVCFTPESGHHRPYLRNTKADPRPPESACSCGLHLPLDNDREREGKETSSLGQVVTRPRSCRRASQ